ncbi:BT4734/BF3469 family protein [Agaribacterium haliotis]|uniref:BT4734/BF3469 family protein n=1 Tax=Agaribacterium haliotis TaxID=2013869 RepID=UPI001177B140|nr:BT4734/BF3469 family protein [Agaribacterium haliotis]
MGRSPSAAPSGRRSKVIVTHLDHPGDSYAVHKPLSEVIEQIKGESLKALVSQIKHSGDDHAAELKKQLPLMIPTLRFYGKNAFGDNAEPTGIIQFDIDTKDNPGIDLDVVQTKIKSLTETAYCFKSPRNGLKFGIMTDFCRNDDESNEIVKHRYKVAYELVVNWLQLSVKFDDCMQHIKYGCFLSHDATAFYNPDAAPLAVNDRAVYTQPEIIATDSTEVITAEFIRELLTYIPTTMNWDERRGVNFAVFQHLGYDGIELLKSHWCVESPSKLDSDLHSQLNAISRGNAGGHIGTLINIAKQHGYQTKQVTGRARRKLKPKPTDYQFAPMVDHDKAMEELRELVSEFFETKQSKFINVSTGSGKTTEVIKTIKNLLKPNETPKHRRLSIGDRRKPRILILVPDHKLAEQYKSDFGSGILHLKGRDRLCDNPLNLEYFRKTKIDIPANICSHHSCHMYGTCSYIEQFNKVHYSVRVMTHAELYNMPSRFQYGTLRGEPRKIDRQNGKAGKHYWQPDYVIVDENCIHTSSDFEALDSDYSSVRNILNDVLGGESLSESALRNKQEIVSDYQQMKAGNEKRTQAQYMTDRKAYVRGIKKKSLKENPDSPVLRQLYKFVESENETYLSRLYIHNKQLWCSWSKSINSKYRNVPKLFLDATASQSVVKSVLKTEFHKIPVKQNPDINVFQCNSTVTKKALSDSEFLTAFVKSLQSMCSKYQNVGIISYMKVPDIEGNFSQWLAEQVGANTFTHFGSLRGINDFENCDCVLVIGRHLYDESEILKNSIAVFGQSDTDKTYFDRAVRMKGGNNLSVNNRVYTDFRMREAKRHFVESETIQAVGRARLIHGKAKDVFIFSNESLGSDIEVTGFFDLDSDPAIQAIQEKGFCKNRNKELQEYFSTSRVRNNRDELVSYIAKSIPLYVVEYKKNYKQVTAQYFISDESKLLAHLEGINAMSVTITPA